jgi:hypothetical protein
VIPQARVSGAILALAGQRNLPLVEVTPSQGKKALTGIGNADKCTMMARASAYGVIGEHASDALGVVLASFEADRGGGVMRNKLLMIFDHLPAQLRLAGRGMRAAAAQSDDARRAVGGQAQRLSVPEWRCA